MASALTDKLSRLVKQISGQARITESNVTDMLREVRMALLEADVALPVVRDFIARVKEKALGQEVMGSLKPGQALVGIVNRELAATMGEGVADINLAAQPPAVILMAGLQGAGKTTTTAKLAKHLIEKRKKKVLTVSGDVYRPAAIEQLKTVTKQAGAEWFPSTPEQKPLDIALAAINGGTGGGFPFRWDESYGARIGVMPLGGPTSAIRWVDIDPCYIFHGVNAHARGDDVVIDVCQLPSMFTEKPDRRPNAVHRYTVGTGGADLTVRDEILSDEQMDLPAIDRRRTGRPHENAWYLQVEQTNDGFGDFTGITRRDSKTGATDRFEAGERYRMNEGTFVADGEGDGEGWLLAYGWDRARGASDLMVFEALDMAKGPIAQVHLPVRVPYGFHGWWLPDER